MLDVREIQNQSRFFARRFETEPDSGRNRQTGVPFLAEPFGSRRTGFGIEEGKRNLSDGNDQVHRHPHVAFPCFDERRKYPRKIDFPETVERFFGAFEGVHHVSLGLLDTPEGGDRHVGKVHRVQAKPL